MQERVQNVVTYALTTELQAKVLEAERKVWQIERDAKKQVLFSYLLFEILGGSHLCKAAQDNMGWLQASKEDQIVWSGRKGLLSTGKSSLAPILYTRTRKFMYIILGTSKIYVESQGSSHEDHKGKNTDDLESESAGQLALAKASFEAYGRSQRD